MSAISDAAAAQVAGYMKSQDGNDWSDTGLAFTTTRDIISDLTVIAPGNEANFPQTMGLLSTLLGGDPQSPSTTYTADLQAKVKAVNGNNSAIVTGATWAKLLGVPASRLPMMSSISMQGYADGVAGDPPIDNFPLNVQARFGLAGMAWPPGTAATGTTGTGTTGGVTTNNAPTSWVEDPVSGGTQINPTLPPGATTPTTSPLVSNQLMLAISMGSFTSFNTALDVATAAAKKAPIDPAAAEALTNTPPTSLTMAQLGQLANVDPDAAKNYLGAAYQWLQNGGATGTSGTPGTTTTPPTQLTQAQIDAKQRFLDSLTSASYTVARAADQLNMPPIQGIALAPAGSSGPPGSNPPAGSYVPYNPSGDPIQTGPGPDVSNFSVWANVTDGADLDANGNLTAVTSLWVCLGDMTQAQVLGLSDPTTAAAALQKARQLAGFKPIAT